MTAGTLLGAEPYGAPVDALALRDYEYDGQQGKRDSAYGEQGDGVEPKRRVCTGSQCVLQLLLASCADDRESDGESRVAAAEQDVRPSGDVEQFRGEPAHSECSGGGAQGGPPPGQPGPFRGHGGAPLLVEIGRRRRNWGRFLFVVGVL